MNGKESEFKGHGETESEDADDFRKPAETKRRHSRISPLWWPILLITSPALLVYLIRKYRRFGKNKRRADSLNTARFEAAEAIGAEREEAEKKGGVEPAVSGVSSQRSENSSTQPAARSSVETEIVTDKETAPLESISELPELLGIDLSVVVEEKAKEGFTGDAGVSYFFRTDRGTILYDLGFGPERPALEHNSRALGIGGEMIDGLVISHLHPDHTGGVAATRQKRVRPSENLIPTPYSGGEKVPCYLPDEAVSEDFECKLLDGPALLTAGIGSTGPLARSLFFSGLTEEQALVARLYKKGLVIFTGCGHQTIPLLLRFIRTLFDEPIYAVGGGMHFPITTGRGDKAAIDLQRIVGTGKPPWQRLGEKDMEPTIRALNEARVKKVLLSGHDSCDYALERFDTRLEAQTTVLKAGEKYRL